MRFLRFNPKFKFRFAAWHVGALVALSFFVLNINRIFIEGIANDNSTANFLKSTDTFFFDRRMRNRGTRPMSGKVGILAIDEKSIGKFGRWPFPRESYSEAFTNLKSAGVKWIGLDVLFSEPERPLLENTIPSLVELLPKSVTPTGALDPRKFEDSVSAMLKTSSGDIALAESLRDFGNVVQAVLLLSPEDIEEDGKDWESERRKLSNSVAQIIESSASSQKISSNTLGILEAPFPLTNTTVILGDRPILGFINNTVENDGIIRKVDLIREVSTSAGLKGSDSPTYLPSLSLQLAAKYLNRKIRIRRDANHIELDLVAANGDALSIPVSISDHRLLLNHYGFYIDSKEKQTPIQISLADAAENRLPKDLPEILILGTTTMGISDVRPSPLSPVANGVEHHVAAVENILRKDFLIREPNHVMFELLLSLVAATIFIILLSKADALVCLIVLIAGYNLIEIIDQKFLFGQGKLIHLGFLHIQNISIFSSMILFRFFVEEREKRKVKGAFQQYLNPSVINQLLSSPEALKLGGEKRELTVFFSDVRGFTSISEMLSPETLANLLNEYFTPMTDIVLESGGLLDKYIGDALMAVWGAPLPMPDHADRALHASLRMLDALDKLRESWKERNLPAIDIGCGINTGMMVVGNMGSTQRFDYTVLGDAVNLGSRLEGITKEYGVRVICSEATRRQLRRPEDFVLRELDSIKVKGKNEPIVIYEVMRFTNDKREFAMTIKSLFEEGLNKYRVRDFEGAMHMMLQILKFSAQDGPASVFLERCEYYKENPPSENWDGVWVMKTK